MFTGIIEETGILMSVQGGLSGSRLAVKADRVLEDIQKGDSIAVNGVCLTAYSFDSGCFYADVMPETLKRSNLGCLPIKSSLNLERAMTAGGRFGGHIVSGHIDGTGTIVSIVRDGNALWYTVRSDPSILRRIIEKGSIAIDGVSLTVARVRDQDFCVSLIPHTAFCTTLGTLKPGCVVNLENDCVGKYIEKFIKIPPPFHCTEGVDSKSTGTGSRITPELLKQYGF